MHIHMPFTYALGLLCTLSLHFLKGYVLSSLLYTLFMYDCTHGSRSHYGHRQHLFLDGMLLVMCHQGAGQQEVGQEPSSTLSHITTADMKQ